MEDVPKPHVLNPDRLLSHEREDMTIDEHRTRGRALESALHESCEYAQQLWDRLDALRHYLVDSLPSQPIEGGRVGGAHPAGPDDEQGWWEWRNAYAGATSVLAGPHEDMGFGAEEADQIARERLAFTGGAELTPETIEGRPVPDTSGDPVPSAPAGVKAAAAFAVGIALGWVQGRTRRRAPSG